MKIVKTTESESKELSIDIKYSNHAIKRCAQRAICNDMIETAILYGKEFFKQGLVFYGLCMNHLPEDVAKQDRKKLANLIVVADSFNVIITAYRNDNPVKYLKKKGQKLR